MAKLHLRFARAGLLSALIMSSGFAQVPGREGPLPAADTLATLRTRLMERQSEREALERMLNALNDVDSVYKAHCPRWVVRDEDLRQRVLKMMQLRHGSVNPESDILVIANPQESQILEVRAGDFAMGRREARVIMSDSLHQQLLFGTYPKRYIEQIPTRPRNPVVFGQKPKFAALSLSAFSASLLFDDGSGIEAQLGHEEIGYHFWSTGSVQVAVMFEDIKAGIIAPVAVGTSTPDLIQPLTIRPRRLTGGKGITLEYDPEVFDGRLTAKFSIGGVTGVTNPGFLADTGPVYSVHTIAQLTYARNVPLGGFSGQLTLRGGMGFHQVTMGEVVGGGRITTREKENFLSPVVEAEYVHHGDRQYGVGAQYYSSIVFAKAWVEIVQDFIFVDVKYYTSVLRAAKPWEQPYFFMVSPRIQVVY